MKKLYCLFTFLCLASLQLTASTYDIFSIDRSHLEKEFNEINQLETYLDANPGLSYSELKIQDPAVPTLANFKEMSGEEFLKGESSGGDFLSFMAGFCCGIPGVAIVFYTSQKDMEKTESAIIGGIVMTVLVVIVNIAVISASSY